MTKSELILSISIFVKSFVIDLFKLILKKDSSIFSRVLLYWINSLNRDENFFKDKGKSWLESPEKWESYIQETLKALDSNKKLLFWIDRGKTFKLYPLMHKSKINDLHINWKLYMNSVKIENIKKRKSMS